MTIPFPPHTRRATAIDIREDRCVTILGVIRRGWNGVLAAGEVDATWREVPITERLRDEMRRVINDEGIKDMWTLPGVESRSRKDVLEPDGLTDIPIAFTSIREELGEQDAHAIIECKKVAEHNSALCQGYVKRGIQRFVRGSRTDPNRPKYAASHAFGFMAGYLLSGSTAGAVAAINRHLPKAESLRPSTIVQESWAKMSTHRRQMPLGPMVLSHAFLPLPAKSP